MSSSQYLMEERRLIERWQEWLKVVSCASLLDFNSDTIFSDAMVVFHAGRCQQSIKCTQLLFFHVSAPRIPVCCSLLPQQHFAIFQPWHTASPSYRTLARSLSPLKLCYRFRVIRRIPSTTLPPLGISRTIDVGRVSMVPIHWNLVNLIGLEFGLQVFAHENAREYLGILPSSSNTPPFLFPRTPSSTCKPSHGLLLSARHFGTLNFLLRHFTPFAVAYEVLVTRSEFLANEPAFYGSRTSVNIGHTSSEATAYFFHRQGVEPVIPISALNFLAITMVCLFIAMSATPVQMEAVHSSVPQTVTKRERHKNN